MTGFEFHMILVEWCKTYPYRAIKDTAGEWLLVMAAREFGEFTDAIRHKVEIPAREAWLTARSAYIAELVADGYTEAQIADAVDLDDLERMLLRVRTVQERAHGRA